MKAASPYLTVPEAAEYLLFHKTAPVDPIKAFHQWRYRHPKGVKVYRRGDVLLFKQHELDAALEQRRAS